MYDYDGILARRPTICRVRFAPSIAHCLKGAPGVATQNPHQIVVYPNRAKLLGYALVYLVAVDAFLYFCLLLAGVTTSAPPPPPGFLSTVLAVIAIVGSILIGVVMLASALVLVVALVCTIYRILVRKPSAIINSDGIIDQCSLVAGGLGLIRWDEIEKIALYAYGKNLKYFCVITHDKRVPASPLTRLFRRSITLFLLDGANLPQWLISVPVAELATGIELHYQETLLAHGIVITDWLTPSDV